ncbi:MAG: glucosamine-6-phosphate deaminase [archaeon]|nr:glucosamine-6-phosphate deaminase [archaeon]
MKLTVANNKKEFSRLLAAEIAGQLREKKSSVIALASGTTPKEAYAILAHQSANGKTDFGRAHFLQLDEYLGVGREDAFANYFEKHIIHKFGFQKERTFMFDSSGAAKKQAMRAEKFVKAKGIDLVVLGIGNNGHIAFNEPGSAFNSRTRAVKLSKATLAANKKNFSGKQPTKAITLGIGTIIGAKKIVLAAFGEKKAKALKGAFLERPSTKVPASALQKHKNVTLIVDKKAGKFFA